MKTLIVIVFSILTISVAYSQTVEYNGLTPNRPVAINGYTFNGVTYNITITYNTPIDGTITSGFSQSDAGMISTDLVNILNTQIPNSDPTQFYIVTGDSGGSFTGCNINWDASPDWARNCNGISLADDQISNPSRGITSFQVAPPPNPVPTLSQWSLLILGLMMLCIGVLAIRQTKRVAI